MKSLLCCPSCEPNLSVILCWTVESFELKGVNAPDAYLKSPWVTHSLGPGLFPFADAALSVSVDVSRAARLMPVASIVDVIDCPVPDMTNRVGLPKAIVVESGTTTGSGAIAAAGVAARRTTTESSRPCSTVGATTT